MKGNIMTPKSHWQVIILFLMVAFLAGCSGSVGYREQTPGVATDVATKIPSRPSPVAGNTTSPTSQEDSPADFSFPAEIEPTCRYMFYLHGKIIEDQGIPALSPEFGEYRYEEIQKTLQSYGFEVISEQRPKNANGWEYAQRTARQVSDLITAGVPPSSITVVGASKGATIAAVSSDLVANPEVNYVLLGTCHPTLVEEWVQGGLILTGNVLAIYDFEDDEYSGSCKELFSLAEGKGLNHHDELVLQVGTGHGILYQPLPEWVLPTVKWANQEW
jgi:hypothetical protein